MRIAVLASLALLFCFGPARADVVIHVDKSSQRLSVSVDGVPRYEWPVSTARWGYNTPNGVYRPQRLEADWYSRKYDMSPMPHSIFFDGGYAIHGSYEVSHLGRPASHGCIRLSPAHAATLFALVKNNLSDTTIVVSGDRPSYGEVAQARPYRAVRHRSARQQYDERGRYDFERAFRWGSPQGRYWVRDRYGAWWQN
jgi:hypothetical protein